MRAAHAVVATVVVCRLESYSCKLVAEEKALYKKFSRSDEAGIHVFEALSPPKYGSSPSEVQHATSRLVILAFILFKLA